MYAFKKIKKSLLLIACALTSFTSYAVDEQFVSYQAGRYAIKNITLIDGTGKPAQTNQTVVINKNKIVNIGATAEVGVAKGVNIMTVVEKH